MGKIINMIGEKYNSLEVIRLATSQEIQQADLKGRGSYWLVKCNLCGKEYIRNRQTLKKGNSKCDCQRTNLPVDLTNQRFGKLTVIRMATLEERKERGDGKRTYCWCKCDCGNSKLLYIKANALLTGNTKSCGCLHSEKLIQYNLDTKVNDLTGRRYGKLVVLYLATKEERESLNKHQERSYFWCQCDCGSKPFLVCGNELIKGRTKSCGCIKSFGEEQIASILNKNNITFCREQTFSDLKTEKNGLLRYDFCIYKNNSIIGLIECDGEFHRENIFNDLKETQERDELKDQYAKEKGIPLLRIEYNSKDIIEEETIMKEVRRWLE